MAISKKILIQIIICFIVVITGVGGFFYFRSQDEDLNKNQEIAQNESNKNEIPTRDQIEEEYK